MSPDLLRPKSIIVQGITGTHGSFHTDRMLDYGTKIVAGTSPHKAGQTIRGVPVYSSVRDIAQDFAIDASVIFVPAPFAKSATIEAIDAGVPLIIIITEGIPVHDMLQIKQHNKVRGRGSVLVGPNCPGLLTPGHSLLGITPASLSLPGQTAIVSRSGTLTYEAMDGLTRRSIGQSYVIGIGGDRVRGSGFVDWLAMFEQDDSVEQIVMIGEIGGVDEIIAAEYIARHVTKPVYAYIAGHTAPAGVQLGHAGAILGSNQLETAQAKTASLAEAGAVMADSLTRLIGMVD